MHAVRRATEGLRDSMSASLGGILRPGTWQPYAGLVAILQAELEALGHMLLAAGGRGQPRPVMHASECLGISPALKACQAG